MSKRSTIALLLLLLPLAVAGLAEEAPSPTAPEDPYRPRPDEIRLDGRLASIDRAASRVVLEPQSFTLPNGKTSPLPKARRKTIILTLGSQVHVRGDQKRTLFLSQLKPGLKALVIGKDAGQGATLTCRELAVWDREQDGKFSLGDAPAPAGTKPSKDAD